MNPTSSYVAKPAVFNPVVALEHGSHRRWPVPDALLAVTEGTVIGP